MALDELVETASYLDRHRFAIIVCTMRELHGVVCESDRLTQQALKHHAMLADRLLLIERSSFSGDYDEIVKEKGYEKLLAHRVRVTSDKISKSMRAALNDLGYLQTQGFVQPVGDLKGFIADGAHRFFEQFPSKQPPRPEELKHVISFPIDDILVQAVIHQMKDSEHDLAGFLEEHPAQLHSPSSQTTMSVALDCRSLMRVAPGRKSSISRKT